MATDGNGNPLQRTSDMEGMSAADRARMYKERAAAAGLGRAPSAAEANGGAPAPPAARPAPEAAAARNARSGETARPASAAPAGTDGAGAGARTAESGAGALTPEQRQRLTAAVQRGGAGGAPAPAAAGGTAAAAASSPAAEQQQRLVYVWPHLVTIEFMASVLALLSMIVIGLVLQSPLEGHANPDRTPNPSKAPWYFLNLQELLLHMHPALAGVIVPSAALALIATIPYIDRNTRDVGKWFGTPKSAPIAWFTTWYTTVVLIALIFFDEWVGVKPLMKRIADATGITFLNSTFMTDIFIPTALMMAPMFILALLVQRIYKPDGARDWMVCLFTGFFVVFIVLTIVGTFFRGQGMHLYWPWDPRMTRIE